MALESSVGPEPGLIHKLATAAYPSFAMLAGIQLDVFTALRDAPMRAEQIAARVGVRVDKLKPLLYALVATQLLTIEEGLFSNSSEAAYFLVQSSPSYLGDHVQCNPLLMSLGFAGALKSAESIRAGTPHYSYDFSTKSEDELAKDFRGTLPVAARAGHELVAKYDFSSQDTLLDVGGGHGGLAIAISEACPSMQTVVVDLPSVIPITRRFVEEAHAAHRVHLMAADVVRGPLTGSFDAAVLRAFIQVLPPDDARSALQNVREVMKADGALYVLGHILDDSRLSPLEEVWHGVSCLSFYDVPSPYTEQELRDWLKEAGLSQIERDTLPNGDGVITARKSS